MDLVRSERFKKDFKRLDRTMQDRVLAALEKLVANPRHPSLHVKKMEGTHDIRELRVSDNHRITYQHGKDSIILRRVGAHDIIGRP